MTSSHPLNGSCVKSPGGIVDAGVESNEQILAAILATLKSGEFRTHGSPVTIFKEAIDEYFKNNVLSAMNGCYSPTRTLGHFESNRPSPHKPQAAKKLLEVNSTLNSYCCCIFSALSTKCIIKLEFTLVAFVARFFEHRLRHAHCYMFKICGLKPHMFFCFFKLHLNCKLYVTDNEWYIIYTTPIPNALKETIYKYTFIQYKFRETC